MSTVYLHIGTPKTGTSYIQVFLGKNRKLLKKQGYIFPYFGAKFKNIRKERNAHFLVIDNEKIYKKAINKLERISFKYKNIILTEESCWNKYKNINRFVDDMKTKNIDVKIIVYVRRQDLFLQSLYAQKVKEGMAIKFSKYIELQKNHLNYYKYCCRLKDIVGEKNIIVRVYEKGQFEGEQNNLATDFLKALGIKYDNKFKIQNEIINQSLTGIYLEIRRILNKHSEFKKKRTYINRLLVQLQNENSNISSYSENLLFNTDNQLEFMKKYSKSNEKLAKEFLGREDGILFKESILEKQSNKVKYSIEEYSNVFSQIILNHKLKFRTILKMLKIK